MKFIEGWYLPDGEKHFSNYLMEVKNSEISKEYQKQQRENSIKFVDSFNTAIDIGACVGFWTRDLCKVFKRIICFEPYKNSSDCLIENLKEFDNYELYNVALSNHSGKGDLLISRDGVGSNSLNDFALKNDYTIQVEKKRLDDYGFRNVDYIKIDVQFYELFVLK